MACMQRIDLVLMTTSAVLAMVLLCLGQSIVSTRACTCMCGKEHGAIRSRWGSFWFSQC